jgi:hypothetical protein
MKAGNEKAGKVCSLETGHGPLIFIWDKELMMLVE